MIPSSNHPTTQCRAPTEDRPDVVIIVLHYNSLRDTERCLHSLGAITYDRRRTVVVDNGSSDGSGEQLELLAAGGAFQFVRLRENRGYAGGNNFAVRECAHERDLVWLLNADTVVDPCSLRELVLAMQADGDVGAAGSKIRYPLREGECRPPTLWGAGGMRRRGRREFVLTGWNEPDDGRYDTPRDCDYLPGCSILIRASAWRDIGPMDERYFMYFEETDWCFRARAKGYRLRYVPTSVVWHYFDDAKLQQPQTIYYYNRNRARFWLRHGSGAEKLRTAADLVFRHLPMSLTGLWGATDCQQREIFRAHVDANLDLLRNRWGRRMIGNRRTNETHSK